MSGRRARTENEHTWAVGKTKKESTTSIEQEEPRGISRSVGEIEWLLMFVVLLYHVFGGTVEEEKPVIVLAMVFYALCIMGFRYANFCKHESR